jgi:thiamine biosynthesis lipoprotein
MTTAVSERPTSRVEPGVAEWSVWSTTARVVVTDAAVIREAQRLVADRLGAVEQAASRFRPESEVNNLYRTAGRPVRVSPLLADLVRAALVAAERTDGDVDPTVGGAMSALGYAQDLSLLPARGPSLRVTPRPAPGWRRIRLEGRQLTLPPGISLDLGATAKAVTADHCAQLVARCLGVGALVSLGGDIATAGPTPDGGWRVLVQDRRGDPSCVVTLPAGAAVATSSTVSRTWLRGEQRLHHIVDPRTCQPARPVWRTATVVARRCVDANAMSTAAIVRGHRAIDWLKSTGTAARLVSADGDVITVAGWPAAARPGVTRTGP